MNDPMFWRLVWKEYRTQRAFWLSIVLFAVVMQLIVLSLPKPWWEAHVLRPFVVSFLFTALYALGCAATLFAAEQEEGTAENLRFLGVPAARVLASKLGFAAASTLSIMVLLWLLAVAMVGGHLRHLPAAATYAATHRALWGVWGVATVEALAWGFFFSLQSARPLTAVCLAAVMAVLVGSLLISLTGSESGYGGLFWEAAWTRVAPLRLAVAGLVLALDAWLAMRWMRSSALGSADVSRPAPWTLRRRVPQAVRVPRAACPPVDASTGRQAASGTFGRFGPVGRLVWQEWRQARRTIALFVGAATVALLVAPYTMGPGDAGAVSLVALALLPVFLGCCVFLAEQEGRRFRFFADHGVSPRRVWLAKQLVWFPVAIAAPLVLVWIGGLVGGFASTIGAATRSFAGAAGGGFLGALANNLILRDVAAYLEMFGIIALVGYAAGQLASILISRGLLAGICGIVLTSLVLVWQLLMGALGTSWLWSVLPIPVALLAATWVRAPDWMLERSGLRQWARLIGVMLVPCVALPPAVAAYRVYEIPATGPGFDVAGFVRPLTDDERETAALYRQAMRALVLREVKAPKRNGDGNVVPEPDWNPIRDRWKDVTPGWRSYLDLNDEVLRLTLAASERADCAFFDLQSLRYIPSEEYFDEDGLAQLLLADAARLESRGELDAAWTRYLALFRFSRHAASRGDVNRFYLAHRLEQWACVGTERWVSSPGQSADRIKRALDELEDLLAVAPSFADAVKTEYLVQRRILQGDLAESWVNQNEPERRLPVRIAAAIAMDRLMPWERTRARRIENVACAEALNEIGLATAELNAGQPYTWISEENPRIRTWLFTTPILELLNGGYTLWWPESLPRTLFQQETDRRALRLILALKAWQFEHGEPPESLGVLVGPYFERLPLDPYSGKPFGYRREGFPTPVTFGAYGDVISQPGRPILWSVGALNGQPVEVGKTESGQPVYKMFPDGDPKKLGAAGWAFPIP